VPKLKTYIQAVTIAIYSSFSIFLLISLIIAYQSGEITFLGYVEKFFWIIVFLIVFILGSQKGAEYLTSSLEKLKAHPDLAIPSIVFSVLYIVINFILFIVTGYAIVTSIGLVSEWGLIHRMPSLGWPLFILGLIFLGIFFISIICLPFFFGVLIFGAECYMLEEVDKGKDPKFLQCLSKLIKDFGLNDLIKLTVFSMTYNFATKLLGERLSRLIAQPFKAWVFVIFFSEKLSLKNSILLALKYFKKRFTESFYGVEILRYRAFIWFLGFTIALILSIFYTLIFLRLPIGEWYTVVVILVTFLSILIIVGIVYGYVNAIVPLYYITMFKDMKKGKGIAEIGKRFSIISKIPFIKYFFRFNERKISQNDIDYFASFIEKKVRISSI